MDLSRGDIVQIVDEEHHWFPALIIVDEVKGFGCQGYIDIPGKGSAYIRLKTEEFEVVGKAHLVKG